MLKTLLLSTGVAMVSLNLVSVGLSLVGIVSAWTIIDLFLLLSGTMRDRADHRLDGFTKYAGICAAVTVLVLVSMLVVALVIGTSSGAGP